MKSATCGSIFSVKIMCDLFRIYVSYLPLGNNFWIIMIMGPPITYDVKLVKANTKPDVL